jgi:hypothetical protein
MLPPREELQTYASACETLLSPVLELELTLDEQDLIVYYATKLFHKFDHQRPGQSRYART